MDETAGQTLEEIILLRQINFNIKYKDTPRSIKRAKGISKTRNTNSTQRTLEEQKTTRV